MSLGQLSSAEEALRKAEARGEEGEIEGGFLWHDVPLNFEFVGVLGIVCISQLHKPKTVWFEERLSRLTVQQLKSRREPAEDFPAVEWADVGRDRDQEKVFAAKIRFQNPARRTNPWGNTLHDRIVHLRDHSWSTALERLDRIGPAIMPDWTFIGTMDLLEIDAACQEDEVWYDVRKIVRPMERAGKFLPSRDNLLEHAKRVLEA